MRKRLDPKTIEDQVAAVRKRIADAEDEIARQRTARVQALSSGDTSALGKARDALARAQQKLAAANEELAEAEGVRRAAREQQAAQELEARWRACDAQRAKWLASSATLEAVTAEYAEALAAWIAAGQAFRESVPIPLRSSDEHGLAYVPTVAARLAEVRLFVATEGRVPVRSGGFTVWQAAQLPGLVKRTTESALIATRARDTHWPDLPPEAA